MRYLTAYYTLTGKTELIAKTIAAELGAEIEQITTEKPIDIRDFTKFSFSNIGLIHSIISKKKTKINQPIRNVQDFDRIILATPVWMNLPTPAVNSYIDRQDFRNKDVVLVATIAEKGNAQNTFTVMNSAITKKGGRVILVQPIEIEKSSEQQVVDMARQVAVYLGSI